MSVYIHSTAIVSAGAQLGENVRIGPFSIVKDDVIIGDNTEIFSSAYIDDGARIGKDCRLFPGVVISTEPQDLKYKAEKTLAIIGDRNDIREYATIHRGTSTGKTVIGSDCMIMAYVHIAHDGRVGNNVIIANATQFGGHVEIEDWAILGGVVKVHQFCHIGCHAMIGADVKIVKEVPPYTLMGKDPAKVEGINKIGLRRRGFSNETIDEIDTFYNVILHSGLNISDGIAKYMEREYICPEVQHCIEFIRASKRGIHN